MLRKNINNHYRTLKRYNELQRLCQNIINDLYNDENANDHFKMNKFKVKNIINLEGDNKLTNLNCAKKETGVYLFLNRIYNPVYIGLAGQGKKTKHSLKDRLQIQLNAHLSNSFVKNIRNQHKDKRRIKQKRELKNLILTYAPHIMVISLGKFSQNNNLKSQALEKILIFLFNPMYNK